jgi:4-hydroxy-3-polyprenylbenzoate decarboxylase
MGYDSLADFISEIEDDGDLVRVSAQVDAVLEIAEITDRICKSTEGSPAVFFENVKDHSIPVVVNLLGSRKRMCRALSTDSFDRLADRISGLIRPDLPEGLLDSLKLVPQFTQLTKLPPKLVKTGACQQVVKMGRDVDLGELPIPHCWPGDAGPTITMGQVYTRNPQSGVRNVGLYPIEVRDHDSLFVHWDVHHDGWRNFTEYQQAGQQMPLAIALGGDPIYTYMAAAPLPANTDECLLGGFLRGKNIELVKCRSIDLEVPAHAEIVIEGMIDPAAPLDSAGPIGRATGFYSLPEKLPTLQVAALTHRSNPIFPAMIPGRPPMEEFWMGKATERLFLPFIKLFVPELVDLHQPRCGAFRNLLFVSIRKQYPQQARKVMNALWSLNRLMVSKMIVVVDDDVDIHDEEQVWFHVGAQTHPGRDIVFCEGPTHFTDHAAAVRGMGHKMGIDATRKLPDEGHPRQWPDQLEMKQEIKDLVTRRWSEYGIESGSRKGEG